MDETICIHGKSDPDMCFPCYYQHVLLGDFRRRVEATLPRTKGEAMTLAQN